MVCTAQDLLVSNLETVIEIGGGGDYLPSTGNGVYNRLTGAAGDYFTDPEGNWASIAAWGRAVGNQLFVINQYIYSNVTEFTLDYRLFNEPTDFINFDNNWILIQYTGSNVLPEENANNLELFTWPGSLTVVCYSTIPSQPTFGLPADVVALITSRFGTVANFLRLRNQGQV